MVAADSEGPEDRPSGKPDLRVEVEGVAGVTSDLGVDLQVTKLWEEGLEASFYLFGWSVQYLPGSSITIIPLGFPWWPQYSTLGAFRLHGILSSL